MGDEIKPEDIASTQKILGKYVNRPPLTDKLLKKPPFRFLHDVINTVIRETGFLKGLFTEAELLSDNVKDREAKVAFLNKLITAVKTITGTDLQVRASKIIAGLEPGETNKLLQAIGKAIDMKLDSKEYVSQLKGSKSKSKVKEAEKSKKSTSKSSVKSDKSSDSSKVKKSVETPKNATSKAKLSTVKETPKKPTKTDIKTKSSKEGSKTEVKKHVKSKDSPRGASKEKEMSPRMTIKEKNISPRVPSKEKTISPRVPSKEKIVSPRATTSQPETTPQAAVNNEAEQEQVIEEKVMEKVVEEVNDAIEETANTMAAPVEEVKIQKPVERPRTASRPRSGSRMPPIASVVDVPAEVPKPEKKIPEPTLIMRPKSSLRPPSVRPSSARPGAPRLRPDSALPLKEMIPLGKINVIVENFGDADNKEDDEEETVVIQNEIEEVPETISIEKSLDIPVDKGHLVEQILEQIQETDQLEEAREKNTWEHDNVRGKDATTKEINQLRSSIQSLTRTANPLGKLMSYLHEDVEAMHSELESWTNMKNQYTSEINVQRRANSESNQPLINQLQDLEENIKKQREEISNVKFNILRNEEKIRDLISKQVVVQ